MCIILFSVAMHVRKGIIHSNKIGGHSFRPFDDICMNIYMK